MVDYPQKISFFKISSPSVEWEELENVPKVGLCETRYIISQYTSVHGPLSIASPAEHRSQDIDEKMWERLEDLDRIKED